MEYNPKWYKDYALDIPTFQDLQNVTGQVFDDYGNYIGKQEAPKQQLVIDKNTKRQYFAPMEYNNDAVLYAKAKIDESFDPEEWYGMTKIKPNYTLGEHISAGYIAGLKTFTNEIAQIPTKLVYAGVVGLNALSFGNLQSQENLYRASMKAWDKTLEKAGFSVDDEIRNMLTVRAGELVGQTASSLFVAATVGSIGGLPAVAAVFGSTQFADVMEESLAKGIPHNKAVWIAFQSAVAEGGLEAVGFKYWASATSVNKAFKNIALGFLWEGTQEASQQIAESAITNFYGVRSQKLTDILAEVALSFMVGGLVGGAGVAVSGQIEPRNMALRRAVGMDEQGRVAPKTQQPSETPQRELPPASKEAVAQELEDAKKAGNNQLYNLVKYIANANGVTEESAIDKLYPVARKMVSDGATLDTLTDILSQQLIAYNNQLDNGQVNEKANEKAVEQIRLATDPARIEEWRESRKSELEKAGLDKETAETLTQHLARVVTNLSNRLGFDITQKRPVTYGKREPQSETLKAIKEREQGDVSFNFGYNERDSQGELLLPEQGGLETRGELVDTLRTLKNLKKTPMPRRHLLTVLREKGADYNNTSTIDKEQYKNSRVPNKKGGIGDSLSDFLYDNGFMGKGQREADTYEEASALEQEAADLIDRALSGEKIFPLDVQDAIAQREAQDEGEEWTKREISNIEIDLTRAQIDLNKGIARILLGETFDPTSVEHEFFHYIDRVVLDAAREGNAEAQKLVNKRNEIIKKAKADLKKQGIKDMPIDEEILASAYEKWLWNGAKSNDATEQKLFDSIRQFFKDVYEVVKGLMGVRITPEMDAYFRAMTGEGRISYQSAPDTLFQEGIKYDKNGKADTNSPEFKKWFGDSKVVDENGKPIVVYHGTENNFKIFKNLGQSRQIGANVGFFFTDSENMAKEYANNKRVMPIYLSLQNPLIVEPNSIVEMFGENIEITDAFDFFTQMDTRVSEQDLKNELIKQGYDGVILRNTNVDTPFMQDIHDVYVAFDNTQIKSVNNRGTFDTESPNIYYQDDKNLAVVHKISSSSLEKAIDLGGFPVPSIGIISKNQPFNIGGDITLVGTSDIIDPSISSNEVYNRDVWSKTFPQTEYKRTTAKARDAFAKKFSPYFERTQESAGALSSMMYTAQAKNPAGVISEFERSLAAKVAYIETVQGNKVNIETKDRSLDVFAKSMWDRWGFRIDEQFVEEAEEAYKIADSKERNNAISKAVEGAFYRTDYSGFGEEADKLKKEMYQNLFEKDGSLNWNAANDIEYRVGEYLSKRGKKTVDYWELRDQLDKQIKNMDDFYEWSTKTVQEDLLGEPMLRVGRTLKPFTLENVTKAMISGTTKNAADALVFGPGKVVAAGAQRLRSIKEIKAAGKKLLTPKQASEQMEALTQEIIAFANEVAGLKQSDFHSAMTRAEDVMRALASVTDKKTPTAEALQRALNYELAENDTYNKELLDAGVKIANNIRNLSRDYFEAKPQRAVSLSEFVGAIIPTSNKYDEIAKKAEDAGLQVVRSDNQTEALSSFSDTFFQSDYQQEQTREEVFQNNQALKAGNKVLDKAPTNAEVENELSAIESGQVKNVTNAEKNFGIQEFFGDILLTVRQRVGVIDKRLKYAFDRMDFDEKMRESQYGKRVVGFIRKYRKLDDTQKKVLDYLIGNKQTERIREFCRKNDMLSEYLEVRTLLDELFAEGNKAGMDMGFLDEYFPTKVNDYKGLISYLMGTDKWSEIQRALHMIDPKNQMSEEDKANVINNILRGMSPRIYMKGEGGKGVGFYNPNDPIQKQGFQKERKIFHKTPEMMEFYAPADEALMRYVSGMANALAIRSAFNTNKAFNVDESVGGIVNELLKSGQITYKEEAFIRKMLKARLNYARTAPIVSLIKNIGYLGTMNSFQSAVTQIGDLYANFYKYGFGTAMKALFGKREVTKEDLHLDSIWEEFSDESLSGIMVNKLFKVIGLNKFDEFGKNTAINGAWQDIKKRLQNNDISLLEDITAAFGSRAKSVLEDIKNNNITEDVKLLLWTQLADTQPIGKSGVPVGYLNHPHGRLLYQLKTYTINQLSLFYADGVYKINKGIATKNKKLFLEGVGKTAKLALLLTAFNAGADVLKNLLMGRKIEISDTLLSNMLWNIGVSKYTFYRGQRDGYARALLENYLMPPQISMGDDAYMDIKKIATGKRKPSDTIAVTYVPFGRMWYWWFGGGRTQEKKKGNKPFQVEF